VIQIVVHQFVHEMSAEKNPKSEKNRFPFIPRYAQIRRISTKEKKMIPYKPYVCKKHVESILGTFLTHEKKINLNTMICDSVHLVGPYRQDEFTRKYTSYQLSQRKCDSGDNTVGW
jgi:hypothetical protein